MAKKAKTYLCKLYALEEDSFRVFGEGNSGFYPIRLPVYGLRRSVMWDSVTLWTVALQVPPSRGFSRQEEWNGLPFPPAGDLPRPRIEPASPLSPASPGGLFISEPPGKLQGSRLGEPN